MSALAEKQKPFFFLIDFEHKNPIVCPINKAKGLGFYFEINGLKNFKAQFTKQKPMHLSIDPVPKPHYSKAYKKVVKEIYQGNTFLLNLTFPDRKSVV